MEVLVLVGLEVVGEALGYPRATVGVSVVGISVVGPLVVLVGFGAVGF